MTTRRKRPLTHAQRTQGEYEARMRRMARAQVIISIILQLYKDRMQAPSYKAVRRMSEEIGISDRTLYNYIYGYCAPSMATLKVLDHYYQHTTSHASANELSRILASIPERPLICNAGEAIEMPPWITTSNQSAPCNNM
jgi:IS30 family transposase